MQALSEVTTAWSVWTGGGSLEITQVERNYTPTVYRYKTKCRYERRIKYFSSSAPPVLLRCPDCRRGRMEIRSITSPEGYQLGKDYLPLSISANTRVLRVAVAKNERCFISGESIFMCGCDSCLYRSDTWEQRWDRNPLAGYS